MDLDWTGSLQLNPFHTLFLTNKHRCIYEGILVVTIQSFTRCEHNLVMSDKGSPYLQIK